MTTFCQDCDHMHPESRSGPSYRAMCLKHPRLSGTGFVTLEAWDRDPPYMLCKDINGGECPTFEPRRDNQMQLGENNEN